MALVAVRYWKIAEIYMASLGMLTTAKHSKSRPMERETTLYSFKGGVDGEYPSSPLIKGSFE